MRYGEHISDVRSPAVCEAVCEGGHALARPICCMAWCCHYVIGRFISAIGATHHEQCRSCLSAFHAQGCCSCATPLPSTAPAILAHTAERLQGCCCRDASCCDIPPPMHAPLPHTQDHVQAAAPGLVQAAMRLRRAHEALSMTAGDLEEALGMLHDVARVGPPGLDCMISKLEPFVVISGSRPSSRTVG